MPHPAGTFDGISCDLTRVYGALQQHALPVWVKLGLSMAQFKALSVVDRAGSGVSVGEVGKRLEIREPSASLLVDQLVRRGYAERCPDPADRRRVLVSVSETGRGMLDELRSGNRELLSQWLERLDPEDAEALARGLRALADLTTREAKE